MFIILYILVIGCKVLFYIIHMTAGIGSSGPRDPEKDKLDSCYRDINSVTAPPADNSAIVTAFFFLVWHFSHNIFEVFKPE